MCARERAIDVHRDKSHVPEYPALSIAAKLGPGFRPPNLSAPASRAAPLSRCLVRRPRAGWLRLRKSGSAKPVQRLSLLFQKQVPLSADRQIDALPAKPTAMIPSRLAF